jgi:tetratricopeptide (TPR) repeat protein
MRFLSFFRRQVGAPRTSTVTGRVAVPSEPLTGGVATIGPADNRWPLAPEIGQVDTGWSDEAETAGETQVIHAPATNQDHGAEEDEPPKTSPDDALNALLQNARTASEAGQIAESRTTLEMAAERFPEAAEVRYHLARLSEAEHDWAGAERWWREYATLAPTEAWVVPAAAHCMRLQGRLTEADAWVRDAMERFPNDAALLIDHAQTAEMRRDWPTAEARWTLAAEQCPDRWEGPAGAARASVETGDLERARVLLERAADRFPSVWQLTHDRARLAETQRDWPAAETWWARTITVEPGFPWGHTGLANALREQGRVADAEAALIEGGTRFPAEPAFAIEPALLAERSENWAQAFDRWTTVVDRFPDRNEGYSGCVKALHALGDPAAAGDVLSDAADRFPTAWQLSHDRARLAETQSDWPAAETWWRRTVTLNPDFPWGHTGLANARREQGRVADAEAVLIEGGTRFPAEPAFAIEYARLAERSEDWTQALDRWTKVVDRFPDRIEGYSGRAQALRALGDPAAAGDILNDAANRFPAVWELPHDRARLAETQRDWPAAEAWWRRTVTVNPGFPWGHIGLANALREQGRMVDAEAVLITEDIRFPAEPAFAINYAALPERSKNWEQALDRWTAVIVRFPDRIEGYSGAGRALSELGRIDEARTLLTEAAKRFPAVADPLHQLARIAIAQQDWVEVERMWRGFTAINPQFWWSFAGIVQALCMQDRIPDADAAFSVATAKFPDEPGIWVEYATALCARRHFDKARQTLNAALLIGATMPPHTLMHLGICAMRCEGWDAAIACLKSLKVWSTQDDGWRNAATRFENDLKTRLAELAPDQLRLLDDDGNQDDSEGVGAASSGDADAISDRMMALRFESLGGNYPGCEIGLVQRTLGGEPLGLLRWTTTPLAQLTAAMQCGFEGVGTREQTELYVVIGNYKTKDIRFYMDMMTFEREENVEREKMWPRVLKRLGYLRRKLIDDLTEGRKIFVYRTLEDMATDEEVMALKLAMNRYGANRLLYLKLANEDNPVGSLRQISGDLCYGYVEKFSREPVAELFLNGWAPVFRQAAALWPPEG